MKIILIAIAVTLLIVSLSGCGASEKKAARQKLKEGVAAVKVRTQGATYAEFRKAQLDLNTCVEANKQYLNGSGQEFAKLSILMEATDYCWNDRDDRRGLWPTGVKGDLAAMKVVNPDITNKLHLTDKEQSQDIEFLPKYNVRLGLEKVSVQCDTMLKLLEK